MFPLFRGIEDKYEQQTKTIDTENYKRSLDFFNDRFLLKTIRRENI